MPAPHLAHLDDLRTVLVAWVIGGHALLGYSVTRRSAEPAR